MERISKNNVTYILGYHTQEFRAMDEILETPIKCLAKNAWLGIGYYFWTEEEFAHYWGEDFKMATGAYDIYKAHLDCTNCINAVFDEEGYFFFRESIEEAILYFQSKNIKMTLEQVNRFLAENIWAKLGIKGIIYDDKPINPKKSNRVYSEIPDLYYKKRIQIVLFSLENIHNFVLHLEEQS